MLFVIIKIKLLRTKQKCKKKKQENNENHVEKCETLIIYITKLYKKRNKLTKKKIK